jgi:hypothetical protein
LAQVEFCALARKSAWGLVAVGILAQFAFAVPLGLWYVPSFVANTLLCSLMGPRPLSDGDIKRLARELNKGKGSQPDKQRN